MTKIKNHTVLITGGASGIGRLMAERCLERGAKCVVIWDINADGINNAVNEFIERGYNAYGQVVDVADSQAVDDAYLHLKRRGIGVDVLINNAGIVAGNRTFDKHTVADIERTMRINSIAPMIVALRFLPDMLERNEGHICNIASAAGMISNPKMSVYAASKWAVVGWSDSVRIELARRRSKVRVTTIAPYYINTGMFDGVHSPIIPILKPAPTVRKIVRAIEHNVDFRGIPFSFHLIRFAQGILPTSWFDTIFGRGLGIYKTMDNFTGRK